MKLQIPVDAPLHAAVKAAAARDGRSVANWCRRVLELAADLPDTMQTTTMHCSSSHQLVVNVTSPIVVIWVVLTVTLATGEIRT